MRRKQFERDNIFKGSLKQLWGQIKYFDELKNWNGTRNIEAINKNTDEKFCGIQKHIMNMLKVGKWRKWIKRVV